MEGAFARHFTERLHLHSSINHHPMTSTLETPQSSPSPTPLKKKSSPWSISPLHRANIELVCIKFQIWRAPVLALVLIVRAGGYRLAGLVCVGYYSVLAVGKGQGEWPGENGNREPLSNQTFMLSKWVKETLHLSAEWVSTVTHQIITIKAKKRAFEKKLIEKIV